MYASLKAFTPEARIALSSILDRASFKRPEMVLACELAGQPDPMRLVGNLLCSLSANGDIKRIGPKNDMGSWRVVRNPLRGECPMSAPPTTPSIEGFKFAEGFAEVLINGPRGQLENIELGIDILQTIVARAFDAGVDYARQTEMKDD